MGGKEAVMVRHNTGEERGEMQGEEGEGEMR